MLGRYIGRDKTVNSVVSKSAVAKVKVSHLTGKLDHGLIETKRS